MPHPPFGVTLPYPLATLTLSGPTRSGSATWQSSEPISPSPLPVLTGDTNDFSFSFAAISGIAPSYGCNNEICHTSPLLCLYDISWAETNGQLNSVSITIESGFVDVGNPFGGGPPFGLNGGLVATDTETGNCPELTCEVTGFWQSNLPISEPMSMSVLASGLAILAAAGFALRHRAS